MSLRGTMDGVRSYFRWDLVTMAARPPERLFRPVFESHYGRAPGADSKRSTSPVSDIDTVVVDSLKALDPNGRLEKPTLPATISALSDRREVFCELQNDRLWNILVVTVAQIASCDISHGGAGALFSGQFGAGYSAYLPRIRFPCTSLRARQIGQKRHQVREDDQDHHAQHDQPDERPGGAVDLRRRQVGRCAFEREQHVAERRRESPTVATIRNSVQNQIGSKAKSLSSGW